MPPSILKILTDAREKFDYLVIATPYHDVASREWADAKWLRNLDPFLFGFLKDQPEFMCLLGRWSQTGLFPLMGEMIADTMNHIRINKERLKNFSNSYWYHGDAGSCLSSNLSVHPLIKFADELLLAYERNLLFPFLRGEVTTKDLNEATPDNATD